MAKEKQKADSGSGKSESTEKAAPPDKKPMIILVVLLMLSTGGAVWFYMGSHGAKATEVQKKAAPPIFVNLEPFTVNLADREHYLQLGMTYEVEGPEITEAMKIHMPILRSRILLLLATKSYEDLGSVDGKNLLAKELVARAQESVPLNDGGKGISAVHFTNFVIQ